jgi:DNA-binding XRE family transcriptional regulator
MTDTIDHYRDKLAFFVKTGRQKLKLTQKDLAEKANVSERTINSIETKNYTDLTFLTVKKVCRALGDKANIVFTGGPVIEVPELLKSRIQKRCKALGITEEEAALNAWLKWLETTEAGG